MNRKHFLPALSINEDQRMRWWREAHFGMFIYWGVYALPAGYYHGQPINRIREWIMNRDRMMNYYPSKFIIYRWVVN